MGLEFQESGGSNTNLKAIELIDNIKLQQSSFPPSLPFNRWWEISFLAHLKDSPYWKRFRFATPFTVYKDDFVEDVTRKMDYSKRLLLGKLQEFDETNTVEEMATQGLSCWELGHNPINSHEHRYIIGHTTYFVDSFLPIFKGKDGKEVEHMICPKCELEGPGHPHTP